MKRFKFTMQTVLNVKRAMETQQKGELAECNARLRAFEQVQEENFRREAEQNGQYKAQVAEGLSSAEFQLWRGSRLAVREKIEYQKKVLEQTEDERARIQKKLVAAMQERKMLERLREIQWEAYRMEEQKEAAAGVAEFIGHEVFESMTGAAP